MRYKSYIIILLILWFCRGTAQQFAPDIKVLSGSVSSDDFSFLDSEIGDARVVRLGEISHYDGNVIEMKARLAEYLITHKGFTTLAFESGIYDVYRAQQHIDTRADVTTEFSNSLFSVWGKTKEFQGLVQFFEQHKKDLRVFGFDYQITGTNGIENLVTDLYAYTNAQKLSLKLDQNDLMLLLESMMKSGLFDEEDITYAQYQKAFTKLTEEMAALPETEARFYWLQIVGGLQTMAEDTKMGTLIMSSFNTTANDNVRDQQMADNLLAYIAQHPKEKIICWGANQHFANSLTSVTHAQLKDFVPMGSYVKTQLKDEVYSLACVTAEDSIYLNKQWYKTPIKKGSFEAFLKESKQPLVFVSSRQSAMQGLVYNRLFSPVTFTRANLATVHDGYLYFDKAIPATHMVIEEPEKVTVPKMPEEKPSPAFDTIMPAMSLEEVVVYQKRTAYQILQQAIDKIPAFFPKEPFSSHLYAEATMTVSDSLLLDYEFTGLQYDRGYTNTNLRNSVQLQQIRYRTATNYKPKEYRSYFGFAYINPLQYSPILNKRKFKKFDVYVIKQTELNGETVYKLGFSSPRTHSTYTGRTFESNYSGYLYIATSDFHLVQVEEEWEVIDFPDHFKEGYPFKGNLKDYDTKLYNYEFSTVTFAKASGFYYIAKANNLVAGEIVSKDNTLPFEISISGEWTNVNTQTDKMSFRKEQLRFDKVDYNSSFWEAFKR